MKEYELIRRNFSDSGNFGEQPGQWCSGAACWGWGVGQRARAVAMMSDEIGGRASVGQAAGTQQQARHQGGVTATALQTSAPGSGCNSSSSSCWSYWSQAAAPAAQNEAVIHQLLPVAS